MKFIGSLTAKQAEILLLSVIMARSTSFMFSKMTLQTMSTFSLLGSRFLLAFCILCVICFKKLLQLRWKTVACGAVVGAIYFGVMALEMAGLKTTSTAETSFLENSAIVIVPLLNAAQRQAISRALAGFDLRPGLPHLPMPVLVLAGKYDGINPPAAARAVADLIPGSRFELFEHSGHMLRQEEPQKLEQTLRAFLQAV